MRLWILLTSLLLSAFPKLFLPPLGKTWGLQPFLFEKKERPFAMLPKDD